MTERKVKLDRANKSILLRALGDVYYGQRAHGGSTEVTGRLILRVNDLPAGGKLTMSAAEYRLAKAALNQLRTQRLPVPVHCLMDEYANISLPKDTFLSALATMRSRAIFCSIIVQNMAQLKAMYKDDWESLVGLCDEFLYLGGTEKETHKYVSELLGKETISTTSYNQSKGRSGSYSINHQQSGRDLMTPDEVRLLDNSKCILFIRGERPVVDYKNNLLKHPNIHYTEDGGAAPYDYTAADNARDDLPGAPENYELLDMDDFLPEEPAEIRPTIQRIRRST